MPRALPGRRTLVLGAGAAVLGLPAWPAASPGRPLLRFGLTAVFLDERMRLLQRWREYLEPALGASVAFVQRGTYGQVMDAVRGGEAHFAWICGYPYVLHQRELVLVAVPQWRGRPLYQSYLIADAAGRVRSLADLRGASFAYSDPLSNSGFLYMQHRLRGLGEDPVRYFGRSFFTHSHRHVVEAVAAGLADGGSVDGYVWETLAELHPELTARTRVIDRSPDFGFPPIVAGARTDPARLRAFAAALLAMPESSDGQAVLRELRLDRFVTAEPSLFAGIAAMARQQAAT
jgi:phosphonate transport system substrate-binding protein